MKTAYVFLACGLVLSMMGWDAAAPVSAAGLDNLRALAAEYRRDVAPIVDQFCLDCHMDDDPAGTISFEGLDTPERLFALTKIWLKAAQTQQHKQMPPPKKTKQPDDAQRQKLMAWVQKLDQTLGAIDPFDPGPAQVRRLNRLHYERSLRDLFGLEHDIAAEVGLPDDPRAFGYDSIANALDIPESLFEKYVMAADAILDRAIDTKPMTRRWNGPTLEHALEGTMPEGKSKDGPVPPPTSVDGALRIFRVNAEIPLAFEAPQAGTYRICVQGWGHKGPNWIQWRPDLGIKMGDQIRRSFPMVHTEAMPGDVDALIDLPEGPAQLSLVFTNAVHGPGWASNQDRFRTLGLEWIEVSGPVARSGAAGFAGTPAYFFCGSR